MKANESLITNKILFIEKSQTAECFIKIRIQFQCKGVKV